MNRVIHHKLNGPAPLAAETGPNFRNGIDSAMQFTSLGTSARKTSHSRSCWRRGRYRRLVVDRWRELVKRHRVDRGGIIATHIAVLAELGLIEREAGE